VQGGLVCDFYRPSPGGMRYAGHGNDDMFNLKAAGNRGRLIYLT
jgi:hypothetical protein